MPVVDFWGDIMEPTTTPEHGADTRASSEGALDELVGDDRVDGAA